MSQLQNYIILCLCFFKFWMRFLTIRTAVNVTGKHKNLHAARACVTTCYCIKSRATFNITKWNEMMLRLNILASKSRLITRYGWPRLFPTYPLPFHWIFDQNYSTSLLFKFAHNRKSTPMQLQMFFCLKKEEQGVLNCDNIHLRKAELYVCMIWTIIKLRG